MQRWSRVCSSLNRDVSSAPCVCLGLPLHGIHDINYGMWMLLPMYLSVSLSTYLPIHLQCPALALVPTNPSPQMEVLRSSYSTYKKEKGGGGVRVPSYTDRVLYHSLPDSRHHLHLLHYTLCDAVTGSDHRPVSAAFALHVNRKVGW